MKNSIFLSFLLLFVYGCAEDPYVFSCYKTEAMCSYDSDCYARESSDGYQYCLDGQCVFDCDRTYSCLPSGMKCASLGDQSMRGSFACRDDLYLFGECSGPEVCSEPGLTDICTIVED